MLLDLVRLKELIRALDDARRQSTGPGQGAYCQEPNRDAEGNDFRWEPKPYTLRGGVRVARTEPGTLPDGTAVLEMPQGGYGVQVPLGVHGRAFLAVDPETGEVHCGKCGASRKAKKKGGA